VRDHGRRILTGDSTDPPRGRARLRVVPPPPDDQPLDEAAPLRAVPSLRLVPPSRPVLPPDDPPRGAA
jgi:hypothetical protein